MKDDEREGSDLATAPASDRGMADKVEPSPSDDIGAQIDAKFHEHFNGTRLGHDTDLYNEVHAFKEDVKQLVAPAKAV